MKILVTGVSGFLGAWAAHFLSELGHETHGVSVHNQSDHLWKASDAKTRLASFSEIDLSHFSEVSGLMTRLKPEMVIHLAATSTLYESQKYPALAFKNNVLATASLLQACVENSVPRLIVSTTDKVYSSNQIDASEPFTEESPLLGTEAYSMSKVGTENLIETMSRMVGADSKTLFTVVRMGNIVAGGDRGPWRLSSSIAHSIGSGIPLPVRFPEATRPWQSVFDALAGLLVSGLSQKDRYGTWNLAPQTKPLTVREILTKLDSAIPGYSVETSHSFIYENKNLAISSQKIFARTGFKTLVDPVEAFESLARWERLAQKCSPEEVNLICAEQVNDYLHSFNSQYPTLFRLISNE